MNIQYITDHMKNMDLILLIPLYQIKQYFRTLYQYETVINKNYFQKINQQKRKGI